MNPGGSLRIGATILFALALAACDMLTGSDSGDNTDADNPAVVEGIWTWVSGSSIADRSGIYGTQGVANAGNIPGARFGTASWVDAEDRLWLFGGFGRAAEGSLGELNDLWRFDGVSWTWVSGSFETGHQGEYGIQGVSAPQNVPPARSGAASWIDHSGNLWLFGGAHQVTINGDTRFNDLWRFDGESWTWISGDDDVNQAGTYGSKGVPAVGNTPGARDGAATWVDSNGHLWLFGGFGRDSDGSRGELNDLWRFDGLNWTWVSGDNTADERGEYPEEGPALVERLPVPGARTGAASWIDTYDNLWLFGGFGFDGDGERGRLSDLWYFNGADWFWVSGADSIGRSGSYGTQGTADPEHHPGARSSAAHWIDAEDRLWLFGGFGLDAVGAGGRLNDLWYFDGSHWTWISGSATVEQAGSYGVQGVASADNVPGARSNSAFWIDGAGSLWLFGGRTASTDDRNDLWRFLARVSTLDVQGEVPRPGEY